MSTFYLASSVVLCFFLALASIAGLVSFSTYFVVITLRSLGVL